LKRAVPGWKKPAGRFQARRSAEAIETAATKAQNLPAPPVAIGWKPMSGTQNPLEAG